MKEDESILQIFQDPLTTIIAIILLNAVWFIIPSSGIETTEGSLTTKLEERIEILRNEIGKIQDKIKEYETYINHIRKEIALLEATRKDQQDISKKLNEFELLKKEVERLKNLVANKKRELYELERVALKENERKQNMARILEEITLAENKIKGLNEEIKRLLSEIATLEVREKEWWEISELRAKIKELRDLIKEKEKDRTILEEKLKEAKLSGELEHRRKALEDLIKKQEEELRKIEVEVIARTKEIKEKEEKSKESLRVQILNEEKEIATLEEEKKGLELELSKKRGIGKYTIEKTKGKSEVAFEAVNGKIVTINEKNYDIEVFREIHRGKIVLVGEMKKKKSIIGENPDEISKPESEFQRELGKLDPEKYYIHFVVRKDSFDTFLKARTIAWEKGFPVSWWPLEGPLYAVSGLEGEGKKAR